MDAILLFVCGVALVAVLGIIPALVLLVGRDKLRQWYRGGRRPAANKARPRRDYQSPSDPSSIAVLGSFFCAWMAARLFTNGWITFFLLFAVFFVVAAALFLGTGKSTSPRAARRKVLISSVLLIFVNVITGNEQSATPPQVQQPASSARPTPPVVQSTSPARTPHKESPQTDDDELRQMDQAVDRIRGTVNQRERAADNSIDLATMECQGRCIMDNQISSSDTPEMKKLKREILELCRQRCGR